MNNAYTNTDEALSMDRIHLGGAFAIFRGIWLVFDPGPHGARGPITFLGLGLILFAYGFWRKASAK